MIAIPSETAMIQVGGGTTHHGAKCFPGSVDGSGSDNGGLGRALGSDLSIPFLPAKNCKHQDRKSKKNASQWDGSAWLESCFGLAGMLIFRGLEGSLVMG